jgi:PAS domain S-box-containing protein
MGTDQRRRILLVDDEPANLLALEALLDGLGLALVKASSGAEALQHLLDQDFALILLDVRMKDMDGLQTAQLIRGRNRSRHTPIIFLTAFEESEFPIVQAYALGAVDYLIKPLKSEILRAKVSVFVELFEKTEQIQRQAEQLRQLERQDFERQLTAEKQRREAVSRLAALVQSSEDAIIGATLDGTITAWNPAAERIYGYTAAEMEGRPAADLVPPERRDEEARILDRLRRGERVEPHETEQLTRNGQRIHVSLSVAPLKDGAGQTVGACLIARDITERKRAETTIRLYADIVRNAPVGVAIWRLENCDDPRSLRLTAANPAASQLLGVDMEELMGRTLPEAFPAVPEGRLIQYADVVRLGQARDTGEYFYRDQRVPGRWWSVKAFPLPDRCVGLAFEDVTERKQAEEALKASEQRLRLLIDTAHDAFVLIDSAGRIIEWNPQAEFTFGWTRQETVGRELATTIIPAAYREADVLGLKRFLATGEGPVLNKQLQLSALHRNGHEFPVELTISAIPWGPAYLFGAFIHDITERQRAEEKIRAHTAQLEAVNKELESFCYAVSHDLRAPLRAIDGFSQAVLEDYGKHLDARGADYLQRVRAASQRMGQLIDHLLKLSRLGRGELRREAVDLGALAQAVADELLQLEPQRQVTFVIAQVGVVQGDGQLLRIVLDNLLGNAWKFTGKHLQARIELGVGARDGRVVYFVRDDGAGFDMAYSAKLFGAFQRLHSDRDFSGTGVGLATVQRIIHRHGGEIWAEGAVEQGATFYFTLGPAGETGHA